MNSRVIYPEIAQTVAAPFVVPQITRIESYLPPDWMRAA